MPPTGSLVSRQIAIRASKRFIICCKGTVQRAVEKWRIVKLRLWQLGDSDEPMRDECGCSDSEHRICRGRLTRWEFLD